MCMCVCVCVGGVLGEPIHKQKDIQLMGLVVGPFRILVNPEYITTVP